MSTPKPIQLRDIPGVNRTDGYSMDPREIHVSPGFNHRDYSQQSNLDHVAEIKESIRQHGVQQPLWVRRDAAKVFLVAGECRLRAVNELIEEGVEIKSVPIVWKVGSPEKILLMSLTENTGKPPSQWEVGSGFQRLIDFGWNVPQIALQMGQKESWVKTALELSTADKETKDLLDQAAITPSAAKYAIRHSGSGASLKLKSQVEAARQEAENKPAPKRQRKSSTPAKPKPVGREKKQNGVFVPFKTLEIIQAAFADVLREQGGLEDTILEQCETAQQLVEKLLPKKEGK